MKVFLRILVIILAVGMIVYSFWPPEEEKEPTLTAESVSSEPTPSPEQTTLNTQVIKDLLGGAALDSGKKATEKISEVNESREKEFEETGL